MGGGAPGRAQPAGGGTGQPPAARKERVPAARAGTRSAPEAPCPRPCEGRRRPGVTSGAGRCQAAGGAPEAAPLRALTPRCCSPPAPAAPGRSFAASAAAGNGLPGAVGSACGLRSAAGSLPRRRRGN